jgi:group I intron endonuclease
MAVIYGLTNKILGKAYIGSTSAKLSKRMREHRCLLRNGKHTSSRLQEDWNRYGEHEFEMRILEELDHNVSFDVRKKTEQKWIDEMNKNGLLYNSYTCAFSMPIETTRLGTEASRTSVGNRWTEETNAKRRNSQLGIPKNHGAKISATKRAKRDALKLR